MADNILDRAIGFAVRAHAGMKRKASGQQYILHPMEAAVIVGGMTNDPEVMAAAMLHDVVEDAGITLEQLQEEFGQRVMELVASETEEKREHLSAASTWELRKTEAIQLLRQTKDLGVKMLYLADKLSNLRSVARDSRIQPDTFWQQFNQKDPQKHHWYYRAIADATAELAEFDAWKEFDRLIDMVFVQE